MSHNFASKASTSIYQAIPSKENPYSAKEARLQGYNLLDLVENSSFVDVIFLQLSGNLPNAKQKKFLNKLMIGFINLGTQHPAVRAAMTAGISKSNTEHILPIGLMVLGGNERGAKSVEEAYKFIVENLGKPPQDVAELLISKIKTDVNDGDITLAPGFGSLYGSIDMISNDIGTTLSNEECCGDALTWARSFSSQLNRNNIGWLPSSIVAAAGIDLGLGARETLALFQLACAPGIVAQGVEQTHKPINAMPFLGDEDYHYVGE